jgi:pimeloyl-ACP methyl ester carboxylesterase
MPATNEFIPIVLVRGFDPLGDIVESPYYGFNDGTVYPQKFGDDFIYEGMVVKFLKTEFKKQGTDATIRYEDATNVLKYSVYRNGQPCVALEDGVAPRYEGKKNTFWIYRYYDFKNRDVRFYAEQLQLVLEMIRKVTGTSQVNLICHSMGGLIARYLIQKIYTPEQRDQFINKWVTLGTPHRGIAFQIAPALDLWELKYFNENNLKAIFGAPLGEIRTTFDPERILCVVGTNFRAYNVRIATALNQLASWLSGQDQNHSDGLVKQTSATLIGAHRADVFKCHGGKDSLVTSREAFELSTRFFFGDIKVSLYLESAEIKSSAEAQGTLLSRVSGLIFSDPEYFLGFSIKPRQLDFTLHQQDKESENCFGPLPNLNITPADIRWDPEDPSRDGLIFQGYLNSALIPSGRGDLAFRFDTYLGERDPSLLGHSDLEPVNAQSFFQYDLPTNKLFFYPTQKSEPIDCVPITDGYRLTLDYGNLSPHFRMTIRIKIEHV